MIPNVAHPTVERDEEFNFPLDLSEWVEKETLLEWIVEDIEAFNWDDPELRKYLQAHPAYRPKMLLRLLTFAYATGVFEAQEIEARGFGDVFFRLICEADPPSKKQMTRFRREQRGLLKLLLSELFKKVLKRKFSLGNVLLPAGLRRLLAETAGERLDLARHLDRAEHD